METTILYRGIVPGLFWIMENEMETTIWDLGVRIYSPP